jgi:hypothetical protein
MTEPQSTPLYKVTGVRQDTIFADGKAPEPAYNLQFEVLGKPGFNVLIPESDFAPEGAQQAVEDVANRIAFALNLEGPEIQFDAAGRPIAPMA